MIFGTGYYSLNYIKQLLLISLRLIRHLLMINIEWLCRHLLSLVDLSQRLSVLRLFVEGVEHKNSLSLLKSLSVDYIYSEGNVLVWKPANVFLKTLRGDWWMNILIKERKACLCPASKTDKVIVCPLMAAGFIAAMEKYWVVWADEVIDASGCMVMPPGLVDL